jgi:hypothetical protein
MTSFFSADAQTFISTSSHVVQKASFYKTVSFGDQIQFGAVDDDAKWNISNTVDNTVDYIAGNKINEYVFEKPGVYEIQYLENKIHSENECNHAKFNAKMLINVSPVKMTFDFSKIKFSEKIRVGSSCEGIIISVPVNVTIKENLSFKFSPSEFMVAGIGSDIVAKPISSEVNLNNGTHVLQYKLSGTTTKETYLMFDFIDYNNNVQTYNQTEIVN